MSAGLINVETKKRSIEDIFSGDADDVEPPKKKANKMVAAEGEGITASPSDMKNIQELLASTKKQIEEKKRQTQSLLAQQGLAQPSTSTQPVQHVQPPVQLPLLQTPKLQASVHPLAYSRELHLVRGTGLGPSALDKAIKAAEVGILWL